MEIAVLVERVPGNGYRAIGGDPLRLSARGETREEALANLQKRIQQRLAKGGELLKLQVGAPKHPWSEFAGLMRNDPLLKAWKAAMRQYRRQRDREFDRT